MSKLGHVTQTTPT